MSGDVALSEWDLKQALASDPTRVRLLPCPDDDPHPCALYFYTEMDAIAYFGPAALFRRRAPRR